MADPKPVLNLTTLTERTSVTINGTAYSLRSKLLRSVMDTVKLSANGDRLTALGPAMENGTITVEEAAELSAVLDETCRMVLDAPDDVHEQLDDLQRLAVVHVFMALQPMSLPATGARTRPQATRHSTGARSSRRSSGSTVATHGIG